jgi:Protein of unknown function (DUF3891)
VLLREEDGDAVVCIGQPAHAWLSGQIARAWALDPVEPWEEVCLAAEQHDVGMAEWDLAPELDPDTGHPRSFMRMPLATHLELWSAAPRRLRAQSRYAALLVSLHGTALYERRDLDRLEPEDAEAVRGYLGGERALQAAWLAELRADPAYADATAEALVGRNQALVWAWDSLSLALLLGWAPHDTDPVPSADGSEVLRLREIDPATGRFSLTPWPFARDRIGVHCEGRRLERRFEDERAMRAALQSAPWKTVRFELEPAGAAA